MFCFFINCLIRHNSVYKYGGAIALGNTQGRINSTNTIFENNTAINGNGGAIFGACITVT